MTPNQVAAKCNILNTEDLEGAFWVPGDGVCDLYRLCTTLIQLARQKGKKVILLGGFFFVNVYFEICFKFFQNLNCQIIKL